MAGGGADKKAQHSIRMWPVGAFLRWWKKKSCGSMSVTSPFSCNIVRKVQFCVGVTLMGVTALNTGGALPVSTPLQTSLYICSYVESGFSFHIKPDLYFLYHQAQKIW